MTILPHTKDKRDNWIHQRPSKVNNYNYIYNNKEKLMKVNTKLII